MVFLLFIFVLPTVAAASEEGVNVYFFYGEGCPHCKAEKNFLAGLQAEIPEVKIYSYEVWNNRDNAQLLAKLGREGGLDVSGVPITIIGSKVFPGFYTAETTGARIREAVNDYLYKGCPDLVAQIINPTDQQCLDDCTDSGVECPHDCGCAADDIKSSALPSALGLPFIGEIETKNFSLPLLTILIAALDGFNPCAMWVLLFLIGLLLGMESRKRMWILGSAFIIASAAVYFLFLSAWLNLFLFLGFVLWIRITIAVVALGSGIYHLRQYWLERRGEGGCEVTGSERRRKVFDKLRTIAQTNKFWVALGGIIVLAAAVNLVELVCSAGLPAVYTQVLSLSNLTRWQYYAYLLLYIFIFMLDDLLVFIIAMFTLRLKAVSSRYTRWSGLVGGIIMVIIGILLLFKPGWLMFG